MNGNRFNLSSLTRGDNQPGALSFAACCSERMFSARRLPAVARERQFLLLQPVLIHPQVWFKPLLLTVQLPCCVAPASDSIRVRCACTHLLVMLSSATSLRSIWSRAPTVTHAVSAKSRFFCLSCDRWLLHYPSGVVATYQYGESEQLPYCNRQARVKIGCSTYNYGLLRYECGLSLVNVSGL